MIEGMPAGTEVEQYMLFDSLLIMALVFAFILTILVKKVGKHAKIWLKEEKERMEKEKEEDSNESS